ncbi:hypothetical protein PROFUN_15392 [Planoprotostelium fungivorum]|uniref:Uncharacterized protein n=1 Tax=Planoprotostelium fungivorum TaxID=1890364 RepID=A0A2P6MVG2_9EUKA|nr:hypothetical protein PROFUN_15392 [Planoprotostelium fungivorum]
MTAKQKQWRTLRTRGAQARCPHYNLMEVLVEEGFSTNYTLQHLIAINMPIDPSDPYSNDPNFKTPPTRPAPEPDKSNH